MELGHLAEPLVTGSLLGLTAGVSPGPMLALVVVQTLAHGLREGLKVAVAPVLTDIPIITAIWLVLRHLAGQDIVLATLSAAGAVYLVSLGWECMARRSATADPTAGARAGPRSLRKAVVTNFLNPHPYMFWIVVGMPMLARLGQGGAAPPAVFLAAFYVCIVGSKMAVAGLVARFGPVLSTRGYGLVMAGLGLGLWVFAGLLARESLRIAGIL
jgi:threonine/homoserine/homoserine lactone efflux protein